MNVEFKRNLLARLCIPALMIAITASAYATDAKTNAHAMGTSMGSMSSSDAMKSTREMRASQLIGMDVEGSDGKHVGKIRDLVVNVTTGEVRYAMLEFDPGIFSSEMVFAIPLKELALTGEDKHRSEPRRVREPRSRGDALIAPSCSAPYPGCIAASLRRNMP